MFHVKMLLLIMCEFILIEFWVCGCLCCFWYILNLKFDGLVVLDKMMMVIYLLIHVYV
jgi:hypothetical protein